MRAQIVELLKGKNAHAPFQEIVEDVNPEVINEEAKELPYTLWQLLEHIRISQEDILEFIKNPDYEEPDWPDDYWPEQDGTKEEWKRSVEQFKKDREELIRISRDKDLESKVPSEEYDYTILRELLLVATHTSYHLGQIVVLRRILNDWD